MKPSLLRSLCIVTLSTSLAILSISCGRPVTSLHPDLDAELFRLASLSEADLPAVLQNLDREDEIAILYRDPTTKGAVLAFFSELTKSEPVAKAILDQAERTGVPTSLAFALAYEESRFKARAINDNGTSIDRGIFQLNSKAFPELSISQFYDVQTNVAKGLAHLDFCLRSGGNEVAALAMYNAGQNRVSGNGTPRRTLDYIFRVTKYQENIASLFAARVVAKDRLAMNLGSKALGLQD